MRIISGTKRGMLLKPLEGEATRPTSDRAKEALFNIIAPRIANSKFLDLFSGSGAIGIEAISRGAALSFFVENKSGNVIEFNLKKADFTSRARVITSDAFTFLNTTHEKFDIIFLDPPYHMGYAEKSLEIIAKRELLLPGGIVIAECDNDEEIKPATGILTMYDRRKYGRNTFNFFGKG